MRIEPMSKVIQEASPELIAKLPEGLLGILKFVRALENLSFCPGGDPPPKAATLGARAARRGLSFNRERAPQRITATAA